MSETTTFQVSGMTCGGCENAVKRTLSQLPGVQSVNASHVKSEVSVTFDPALVTIARLKSGIESLGYTTGA